MPVLIVVMNALFWIEFTAKPQWVVEPKSQEVSVDGNATFQCKARGMPPPQVQWSINGLSLTGKLKFHFLPPQTEIFLYIRLNSQCCLSLPRGKDSLAWMNTLWRHKSYNDMTSWLTKVGAVFKPENLWSRFLMQKWGNVMRIEKNNQPRLCTRTVKSTLMSKICNFHDSASLVMDCESLTFSGSPCPCTKWW